MEIVYVEESASGAEELMICVTFVFNEELRRRLVKRKGFSISSREKHIMSVMSYFG